MAFLGPNASFSHQAALESFGATAELFPCLSFANAFLGVQQQEVDFAVIPIENSTNGSVVQTFDLLADRDNLYSDVRVCGEYYLAVHHCLLVRKDAFTPTQPDYHLITKLYTHPQAWGQCEQFLSKYFKGVERQDVSSTSKAAEIISTESSEASGAIASSFAAQFHGAHILEANIEDQHDNTTRFLILRNVRSAHTASTSFDFVKNQSVSNHVDLGRSLKTLLSFTVKHKEPGALAEALLIFKRQGLNLTSMNTRPSLRRPWQYIFFLECHRDPTSQLGEDAVTQVLSKLRNVTESCRHIGTWRDQLC